MSDEAQDLIETVDRVLHDMGNPNPRESRAWLLGFAQNVMKARAAPKVKELVWHKVGGASCERLAQNHIGVWSVYRNEAGTWTLDTGEYVVEKASEDDALDHAQADCERRVMTCLEGVVFYNNDNK